MTDKELEREEEPTGLLSKTLKVAAIPISVVAGYLWGSTSIRNSAYDNAKFHEAISDFTGEGSEYYRQLKTIGKKASQVTAKGGDFDLPAAVNHLHHAHTDRVTERLKKLHLGTLSQQWSFSGKHHRQKALMEGFAAGAIAMGALFAAANNKALSKVFVHKQKENDSEPNPPAI